MLISIKSRKIASHIACQKSKYHVIAESGGAREFHPHAPSPIQRLHHYYELVRPRAPHKSLTQFHAIFTPEAA
jgi:hypothetical protein